MTNRTLSLKRESLAELSPADLDAVIGGNTTTYVNQLTRKLGPLFPTNEGCTPAYGG